MRTSNLIQNALVQSLKYEKNSLGESLRGNGRISVEDMESLFQMLHDEIADQYYEDAPDEETQSFLNALIAMKESYHRYY